MKASVKLTTFVRENQIIPWQGVYFFTNTVLQNHRNIYTVVMKNMMNTIGKKIHTLVIENTPRSHKIRLECGFTQKVAFFYLSLCFLPTVVRIFGGRLDLCFLTHTNKRMTLIHALIFQKHVKCVFL